MNLDEIWQTAVNALANMRKGGEKVSRAELDAFVRHETATLSQPLQSFSELAQVRMRHQSIQGAQEAAAAGTPSPAATFAQSFGNEASFGLANKLSDALPGPSATDYAQTAADANPMSSFVGGTAGGAASSLLLGAPAQRGAAALISKVPALAQLPGLLRLGLAGAGAAGAIGAGSAYTHGDLAHPDLPEMGKQGLVSALMAGPAAMAGGWAGAKFDPSEHLAGRALQESTPNATPNLAAGIQAVKEGTVTPSGSMYGGSPAPVLSQAQIDKLPEELRPFNFERSPALRVLAGKRVTESGEAAAQAEQAIKADLTKVVKAKQSISNNLATGYDAILESAPIQDASVPEILARYKVAEAPTGRNVFDLEQKLSKQADHMFTVKSRGTAVVDMDKAFQLSDDAQALREVLSKEVPGFDDLQAKVQPYLQRQGQLQNAIRQIVGRTIKPRGKPAPYPIGGTLEGLKESTGLEKTQVGEKAARKLIQPLFSKNFNDYLDFVTEPRSLPNVLSGRAAGATAGAVSGAAASKTSTGKKVRGLFDAIPNFFTGPNLTGPEE